MSDLSWEPFLIAAKKCLLVKSPLGTYYIHYRGHTVKLEYAIEMIISVIIIIIIVVISSSSSIRSMSVMLIITSCKIRCLVFLKECLLYGFVFCCLFYLFLNCTQFHFYAQIKILYSYILRMWIFFTGLSPLHRKYLNIFVIINTEQENKCWEIPWLLFKFSLRSCYYTHYCGPTGIHEIALAPVVVADGPWGMFARFKTYKELTHTNKFGQCCFNIWEHYLTHPISGSFHTSHFINL